MDEPFQDLDVPALPTGVVRPVAVPARPLAPWLRFAHALTLDEAQRVTRAPVRRLLDFELVLQLDGRSWIWSQPDGGSVDLLPGTVALIPPGFVHAWGSEVGTTIAVHFDLHARPQLALPANIRMLGRSERRRPLAAMPGFRLRSDEREPPVELRLVTAVAEPERWRALLGDLVELWDRRAVRTLAGALRATEILGLALRTLADERPPGPPTTGPGRDADPRVLEVLRRLGGPDGGGLGPRPRVSQLAALAHMSEGAFRAAFARATGSSPRRYLEQRRMAQAARALVESDRTVAEIARAVGYDDPYHFSRAFRRVHGVSPRGYRR
ncbi:helix-turn-helix transcriptional regulator [Patulibacter defluvii]|uniref:helix-turn-helix transcriptional regulator n=1 Tax=Patulibacter defluvii TaxID=3095358 RepID=UPI002A76072A|nr:helix-turn-helix transcriptional regulator [Patulibacter sp. DM4]